MGKFEIETTLSIAGANAENLLTRNGANLRAFVMPAYQDEGTMVTPFGKIGVSYEQRVINGDAVKFVVFDCSDAPALRGSVKKPRREIAVNAEGTGLQQFRNVELFVATKHFRR